MPNLTTVTLPAGLTSIPKDAFYNSTKLATVKFGTADAGTPSARDVTGAENAITLPSGITSIGQNAFASTAASTVDLSKITANFTTIDNSVFKDMASLKEVKLPATITTINQSAFQNDAALKKLSTAEAKVARDPETTPAEGTATFGKSLTAIRDNAFQGTGFTTVDLSAAGTATASTGRVTAATPTPNPLTVGSNAFTNMVNLTTVTLPANANINPTYFGNPADAAEGAPKLNSITYGAATATATIGDGTISSTNFSKIKNETIEIKSSFGNSGINFNGGVFNGNADLKTLKLNVTQSPANGNAPL